MSYRLSRAAREDLVAIGDFVSRESGPVAADRLIDRIFAAFERIAELPGIGRERPDFTTKSVRVWRSFDYLIIYRRGESFVSVLRVWHGARDPGRIDAAIREAEEDG